MGWKIRVITVKEKYYKDQNKDSLMDIAGAEIVRTQKLPGPIPNINEEGIYWLPVLFPELVYQVRTFKPEVLFFTGGPFIQWLAAPILNKLWRIPYILDFRDPWRLSPYRKPKSVFSYGFKLLCDLIEPMAIRYAAAVINVSEPATEMHRQCYHQYPPERLYTIPNGVDPEDLGNLEPVLFTPFDIVYLGKFGGFRDPRPFLEGFRRFIETKKLTAKDCRLVWVGNPETSALNVIQSLELGMYCEVVGFKPYKEGLRYVKGSRVCLLISGHDAYEPTTKVFDYIALGKPILALLGANGFLSNLLAQYPLSKMYIRPSSEEIALILQNMYDRREDHESANITEIERIQTLIDRKHNAVLLDQILRRIVGIYAQ